jgi:hypothetical protein
MLMDPNREKLALNEKLARCQALAKEFPDGPTSEMIREIEEEIRTQIRSLENAEVHASTTWRASPWKRLDRLRTTEDPVRVIGKVEVLMSRDRNNHRTALLLFAVAVVVAIVGAFFTTLQGIETRTASNEAPPTGLSKPQPPLDLTPGQPMSGN